MTRETTYTLASLQKRQEALQEKLNASREKISEHWQALTAEPEENNVAQHWMNQVGRAVAIYDGVMTGYKLFRRFRAITSFFGKRKKKKR